MYGAVEKAVSFATVNSSYPINNLPGSSMPSGATANTGASPLPESSIVSVCPPAEKTAAVLVGPGDCGVYQMDSRRLSSAGNSPMHASSNSNGGDVPQSTVIGVVVWFVKTKARSFVYPIGQLPNSKLASDASSWIGATPPRSAT